MVEKFGNRKSRGARMGGSHKKGHKIKFKILFLA
jgi:hypothetical protein